MHNIPSRKREGILRKKTRDAQSIKLARLIRATKENRQPLEESTKQQIIDDVLQSLKSWDPSKSANLRKPPHSLPISEIAIAAMMEALYKRHCKEKISSKTMVSDADLDTLFNLVTTHCGIDKQIQPLITC